VPCRPRPRAEAAGSEEIDLKERLEEVSRPDVGSAACDMPFLFVGRKEGGRMGVV